MDECLGSAMRKCSRKGFEMNLHPFQRADGDRARILYILYIHPELKIGGRCFKSGKEAWPL